jgi:hypothetical protein
VSALYKTEIRAHSWLFAIQYIQMLPRIRLASKPTLVRILVEIMESNPDAVLVAAPAP